jgi:AraC-like DNA-binding protein
MNALAGLLRSIELEAEVFFRGALRQERTFGRSGDSHARFHVVTSGCASLRTPALDGSVVLQRYDLALFPRGAVHVIGPAAEPARSGVAAPGRAVGRGASAVDVVCGGFDARCGRARLVLDALPDCVLVSLGESEESRWLGSLLEVLGDMAGARDPGRLAFVDRIAELLLTQAVRQTLDGGAARGLLAGWRDPRLARALDAMHGEPAESWDLESLARLAALSKSAFCSRFRRVLGRSPMRYLAEHRMALARGWLAESGATVLDVALRCGYETEAAFSKAFKRQTGLTPGEARRDPRKMPTARRPVSPI